MYKDAERAIDRERTVEVNLKYRLSPFFDVFAGDLIDR